jgi:hypothetical protein
LTLVNDHLRYQLPSIRGHNMSFCWWRCIFHRVWSSGDRSISLSRSLGPPASDSSA